MNDNKLEPWQKSNYDSFGVFRLNEEIIDFCNYIQPTELENLVRHSVVKRIEEIIKNRWPLTDVRIFGSFATGLYLPSSDIDIVLFGEWTQCPLKTIEKLILDNKISTNVRVVPSAAVPIVKYVDLLTGIRVDISLNKDNGVQSIGVINKYLRRFPYLRPLFLVLKQFMLQRDLNEVFTGGIGSYCLMLLCISFMQHYNKIIEENINLGSILLEFFEFYSKSFNFIKTGISVSGNGFYKSKYISDHTGGMLHIVDPIDDSNDVGRSCFGIFTIRDAFARAYSVMNSKVIPIAIVYNNKSHEIPQRVSILGSIISIDNKVIDLRQSILEKFSSLVNHDKRMYSLLNSTKDFSICKTPLNCSTPTKVTPRNINTAKKTLKRKKTKSQTKDLSITKINKKKQIRAKSWVDLQDWSRDNVFEFKQC